MSTSNSESVFPARGHCEVVTDLALVVCTRNRPDRIFQFLENLGAANPQPAMIIFVDSSEADATETLIRGTRLPNVRFVKSLQGAPHQKNMGILALRTLDGGGGIRYLSFLDDDIQVRPDYFQEVRNVFRDDPEAVCVGGFDVSIEEPKAGLLRRILVLGSSKRGQGVILRSGIALTGKPTTKLQRMEWVPGGMQSFDLKKIGNSLFDGRIRIYGDEVEFQLRMRKFGVILSSSELGVIHHGEQAHKDSVREIESYMDGFRWTMATRYPLEISKTLVITSTLGLLVGEGLRFLIRPKGRHGLAFLGHLDFLKRVSLGHEVQQFVNHPGSGPVTDESSHSQI